MCDTSLVARADRAHKRPVGPHVRRPVLTRTALTSKNAKTPKVIGIAASDGGTYPQFGPAVHLAYTRWRATW